MVAPVYRVPPSPAVPAAPRFADVPLPRAVQSPTLVKPSPVAVADRWPALPVREASDPKETWKTWQQEERHRQRIDVEQRGQVWTV